MFCFPPVLERTYRTLCMLDMHSATGLHLWVPVTLFLSILLHTYSPACTHVLAKQGAQVRVRGQLPGVSPLLPPCGLHCTTIKASTNSEIVVLKGIYIAFGVSYFFF